MTDNQPGSGMFPRTGLSNLRVSNRSLEGLLKQNAGEEAVPRWWCRKMPRPTSSHMHTESMSIYRAVYPKEEWRPE